MNMEIMNSTDLLDINFEHTHTLISYLDTNMNLSHVNRNYERADEKETKSLVGKVHRVDHVFVKRLHKNRSLSLLTEHSLADHLLVSGR